MKFLNHLLHNLFAYNCIACGRAVEKNRDVLCKGCSSKLLYSIPSENKDIYSCVSYKEEVAKRLVLYMKDHKDADAFSYSASLIALRILRLHLDDIRDYYITFAPRSPHSRLLRGFDQSEEIARLLSAELFRSKDRCLSLISRKRSSKEQKSLDSKGRAENIRQSLSLRRNVVVPKKIIVIDDVTTTGATLFEIKRILLENGAEECILCTLAVNK